MNDLCRSGKTAYPDEEAAKVALVQIQAENALQSPARRTPRRVYECPFCAAFHLTSRQLRGRRAA